MEQEVSKMQEEAKTQEVSTVTSPPRNQRILELKKKLVLNPDSIVIVPHTEEGFAFAKLLLVADKYIWLLRKKAGVKIPIHEAEKQLQRFSEFLKELEYVTGPVNRLETLTVEDKYRLAHLKRSFVFVPRSLEARIIAEHLKKIDPMILQMRATEPVETLLKKARTVALLIKKLDEIVRDIAQLVDGSLTKREQGKVYYKTLPEVKRVLRWLDDGRSETDTITEGND